MSRFLFMLLLLCFACSPSKQAETFTQDKKAIKMDPSIQAHFDACGVEGVIVIFDQKKGQWIMSDSLKARMEYLPASTFKIINLLIALETKVIKNENEIVPWVGETDTIKYGFRPEIYHDMTVKEAFEISAGWVFIELAKRIGKENYRKYLSACSYGNGNISESDDDFWNFGNFAISPMNQVEFVRALHDESLPFSKKNMKIVKKVMLAERTKTHTIRAKTGWTRENNTNTGWWVGSMETKNNTYFFATLLLQDRKNNRADFGSCRKEITKKVFSALGYLHPEKNALTTSNSLFLSIDHAPIVVNSLTEVKDRLSEELHFTVKEGKVHEGIQNCFVKFQDGTYLEFVQPLDSVPAIGKYYWNCLKKGQGGTSFAISVSNSEKLKAILREKKIPFAFDQNKFWQTIEPEKSDYFFIEYANKAWKESTANVTHVNSANSLSAVYLLTKNFTADVKKYKSLGCKEMEKGVIFETPYQRLKVGQNDLILLDGSKSKNTYTELNLKSGTGICGFQIKVNSLQTLNQSFTQKTTLQMDQNRTIVYWKTFHLFFEFVE